MGSDEPVDTEEVFEESADEERSTTPPRDPETGHFVSTGDSDGPAVTDDSDDSDESDSTATEE